MDPNSLRSPLHGTLRWCKRSFASNYTRRQVSRATLPRLARFLLCSFDIEATCGSVRLFCVFFARERLQTEYKTKPHALKAVRGAAEQCRGRAGLDNVAWASRRRAWRDAWDFFLVNYRGRFFWASDRRWFPPDEFRFSRRGNRFLYLQTSGCDCAFL